MARPSDPLADVPDPGTVFKNPQQATYMQGLLNNMRRNFSRFITTESASQKVLLQSPNGTTYQLTVADNGTVTTTVVTRN